MAIDWQAVAKLPISLFHTLKGPVIGRIGTKNAQRVRVYAPAMLGAPLEGRVLYSPILFCEEYIELFWTTMFGQSSPPKIVIQGYRAYFEKFIEGAYKLKPILINAGIESDDGPVTVDDPRLRNSEGLSPCPGCNAMLSHWAAHYPVHLDGEPSKPWACEVTLPNIRELFPDYDAQAVVDAQKKQGAAQAVIEAQKGEANGTSPRI